MPTSSGTTASTSSSAPDGLRLHLSDEASGDRVDGAWWPRSRDLQREAADLVDHFPADSGQITRLLFSRPDWDRSSTDGVGSVRAARGTVEIGSFPSDDTHLMILTMSSGRRLKLLVVASDTPDAEAEEMMHATTAAASPDGTPTADGAVDWDRWDDESPTG